MAQIPSLSALVKGITSEPNFELGDILQPQKLVTKTNFLVVGVPGGVRKSYGITMLEFPDELLWKQLKSGIIIPGNDFIPDLQHHPYWELKRDEAEFNYNWARIGHVHLSEEDIPNSEGIPILHIFPELRKFYCGSGHYQ